jgi:hypothetical protein
VSTLISNTPVQEQLLTRIAAIPLEGFNELFSEAIKMPEFRALEYSEGNRLIVQAQLRKKQDAMKARQEERRTKAAKSKNAKANGSFKSRRLRTYPDYVIDENGQVIGPNGTVLKFRWNKGQPYVRIAGKDRAVFWLLVDAVFGESPAEKKRRRAQRNTGGANQNITDWRGKFNDLEEAQAEEPEIFGYRDGRDASDRE